MDKHQKKLDEWLNLSEDEKAARKTASGRPLNLILEGQIDIERQKIERHTILLEWIEKQRVAMQEGQPPLVEGNRTNDQGDSDSVPGAVGGSVAAGGREGGRIVLGQAGISKRKQPTRRTRQQKHSKPEAWFNAVATHTDTSEEWLGQAIAEDSEFREKLEKDGCPPALSVRFSGSTRRIPAEYQPNHIILGRGEGRERVGH